MRTTTLAAIAAAFLFGTAAVAFGQAAPATKPAGAPAAGDAAKAMTAEQVLEKHVEAIGGRAAMEKHSTLTMKGTIEVVGMGMKGPIEVYSKAPNKLLVTTEIPGFGTSKQGFNGTVAWSSDPVSGMRELSGVELAQFKRGATFAAEARWRELWKSAELTGTQKVGDREAYVVKLTPAEGNPTTNYYDAATFLLLRSDTTQEGPMGTFPTTTSFSDYREVSGVKLPFGMEQQAATVTLRFNFTEATYGTPIDDATFEKPQK
jgi:hypothetical protein